MDTNQNFEGQPDYKPLDFSDVLSRAFDFYKQNLGLLIIVHLVAALLTVFTAGILAGPLYAGIAIILLALYDKKDPQPVAGDIFKGFEYFLPAFLLFVVVTVITSVVWIAAAPLAPIAGLAVGAITMFSYFLIVERKLDFWPAVVESYNMVKGNFWVYLGLYVIGSILASIGIIACCVGIIATIPYLSCVQVIAYRETKPSIKDPVVAQDMAASTSMA